MNLKLINELVLGAETVIAAAIIITETRNLGLKSADMNSWPIMFANTQGSGCGTSLWCVLGGKTVIFFASQFKDEFIYWSERIELLLLIIPLISLTKGATKMCIF